MLIWRAVVRRIDTRCPLSGTSSGPPYGSQDMCYVDGLVIVHTTNKQTFIEHASQLYPTFLELGAIRVMKGRGDKVPDSSHQLPPRSPRDRRKDGRFLLGRMAGQYPGARRGFVHAWVRTPATPQARVPGHPAPAQTQPAPGMHPPAPAAQACTLAHLSAAAPRS